MKVAFILTHTSQGSPGSFERVRHLCRNLISKGIECTILTPYEEDYGTMTEVPVLIIPNIMNSLKLSLVSYSILRKLSFSRLGSKILLSDLALDQSARNLAKGINKCLSKNKFDIVHAIQPVAALAYSLVDRDRTPWVTDLHNIWPEELATYGLIEKGGSTFSRLQEKEKKIINLSDSVTVVSNAMKSYILDNYSAKADSLVVLPPAGFISDRVEERGQNVVYAGLVSQREHVDLFARSIPYVNEKASFHISNYGDDLNKIKMITQKSDSSRVSYSWFKDRQELIAFLHKSRIGIVTSQNDLCRQMGPALKLFEYISCGLPVVANDIGGWTKIIEDEEIGILTKDDPMEFARAINLLLNDGKLWKRMHENALGLVRSKLNWELNITESLIPLYERLITNV